MIRALWLVDRALIVLFALASGIYKVSYGPADVEIYAHLGFSATATAVFGAVQAVFGLGLLAARTRVPAAIGLAVCNAVATAALFAAGVYAFGFISVVFIAMAAVQVWAPPRARA